MYVMSNTLPLPTCLHRSVDLPEHRRYRIGSLNLTPVAVDRFNRLLERVGPADAAIDGDRLVTAARSLLCSDVQRPVPTCIQQRLLRVKAAVSMAADRPWSASGQAVETIRLVAEYVAANDDLIPDSMPTVGRLDDAIVVETAWPTLQEEMRDYMDFRRLRRLALSDRTRWAHFSRDAWQQAQIDEIALLQQRREIRERAYHRSFVSAFRVC